MSKRKTILYSLGAILIVMQFFRIDKTNPVTDPALDMMKVVQVPTEIQTIIRTSCYDCHSNESKYPWYTNVAPVSWFVKDHINEAREELNFSEWGKFTLKRKDHKLDEMVEELEEGEMPLSSYLILHGEAKLSGEQKSQLINWAKKLRTDLGYVSEEEDEDDD
jgi:Haem-binding domain